MCSIIKKSYWANLLLLLSVSICYDLFLFLENIMLNPVRYMLIVLTYLVSWAFVLRCGRFATSFFLILNFAFFCLFKEYYKFHVLPLDVFLFKNSFTEGLNAGTKNIELLFDMPFFIFLGILIAQLWITLKGNFASLKRAINNFLIIFFMVILYFSYMVLIVNANRFNETVFFYQNQKNLVYKFDWTSTLLFSKEKDICVQKLFEDNEKAYDKMKQDDISISLPRHILIIQVESFTTKSMEYMPFIKKLLEQENSKLQIDKNHGICLGSGNTDFMMLTSIQINCEETRSIFYEKLSFEMYKKLKTMPQTLKSKGYKTSFLHNYDENFYQRVLHIPYMGFDNVVFEQQFDSKEKRYEWGVDDFVLFKKASEFLNNEDKTFHFIVTAGMHTPFTNAPYFVNNTEHAIDKKYKIVSEFFDQSFEWLYKTVPNDTLFIVYGDHNLPTFDAYDTPFILLYKGNKEFQMPVDKKDGFKETIYYINSLFL